MTFRLAAVDVLVRKIASPRVDFRIGGGQSIFPDWMRINLEVRVEVRRSDGRAAWGCSADWPSFGWLDKRSGIEPKRKLLELLQLVSWTATLFRRPHQFTSPFECWWQALRHVDAQPEPRSAVPLCESFAMALFERAVLDAWCRLENLPFHAALRENRLGLNLAAIHPELSRHLLSEFLPVRPHDHVFIRHTIGLTDPLNEADAKAVAPPLDGVPWTLSEYAERQAIRYFKVKIRGDADPDLQRLAKIWEVLRGVDPKFTLDANESFHHPSALSEFLERLARELPEFTQSTLFIEQPLDRSLALDDAKCRQLEELGRRWVLTLDEGDGSLSAFREGMAVGYRGVSHKNCKGLFKSLANFVLAAVRSTPDRKYFLSAEDLTDMPVISLVQDFAVVAALGLEHAERNAHHFFRGLDHLSADEQAAALDNYPRLFQRNNDFVQLTIQHGQVDLADLHGRPGLGIASEPDWDAMTPLDDWLRTFRDSLAE